MRYQVKTWRGRLCGAGLLSLATGCGAVDADRAVKGEEYGPSADLVRLQGVALDGDDIGLVRDFDIAGDTIYLLDGTGRVAILVRDGTAHRLAGHFGRRGAGPGEFLRPSGLAVVGNDIVVLDGTRLQFLDRSGRPRDTRWVTLPCAMMLPLVAPARDGLFIHGGCLRQGMTTDTMKGVLAWSADTASWEIVAEAPRFTSDGTIGTVFGGRTLLTTGVAGRHAFGGGEVNCIWTVGDDGGRPDATETCPVAGSLYSADPPPGLEERLRSARFAGMRMRWPETLPVYTERFVLDDDIILLRPFAADSVVLQTAAPASVDLAVAPLEGLIGCKAAGCLWLLEDTDVPRLIVLDRARIEAMVTGAAGR
jgi:hypothetical protein